VAAVAGQLLLLLQALLLLLVASSARLLRGVDCGADEGGGGDVREEGRKGQSTKVSLDESKLPPHFLPHPWNGGAWQVASCHGDDDVPLGVGILTWEAGRRRPTLP